MHCSNHTGHYLHAQITTALQPDVFLTEIYRILVTNKRRSAFLCANPLPRSAAHSSVSISSCSCHDVVAARLISEGPGTLRLFQKNTYYVQSIFVASIILDVFETDRTIFVGIPSYRATDSPPSQWTGTLSYHYDTLTKGQKDITITFVIIKQLL
jgi:hypothetical protein